MSLTEIQLNVSTVEAEVVHGVSVDRIAVDFLMVVKYTVAPERPGSNDVSVCHDVSVKARISNHRLHHRSTRKRHNLPSLSIHHEASRFAGQCRVCVERARLTKALAKIKEEEGDINEAASILQEVAVVRHLLFFQIQQDTYSISPQAISILAPIVALFSHSNDPLCFFGSFTPFVDLKTTVKIIKHFS